ncbi:MAG: PIN domain-containing protein [Candidatus Aenigmarchaeota archaeon]|nr:PIN domain-containing protein [Candidatus Aenigmarchaeota archaeon]
MKCFIVDTNIFGISLDKNDWRYEKSRKLLEDAENGEIEIIISEQTMIELQHVPNPITRQQLFDILIKSCSKIIVFTPEILLLAEKLKEKTNISYGDAKIIITAVLNDIEFKTWDYKTIFKGEILKKIQDALREMNLRKLRISMP